ncbi:glutathione S-transferase domain protein [Mycobacterium xenopi 4042]|uniref:Glutathione S-transferase domain protein n=1 Tax=Mycobacterium xenopi 4042 TaxID=1299334 RepID=X8AGC0_MYCXE|nr:glutathione S-transferase domain protein [Mycobacterium xenopi 4042]
MSSYVAEAGEFTRDTDYIATRITADGRDGYPVEPGRYRLIVARACPWPTALSSCGDCLDSNLLSPLGFAAQPTTNAAGLSTSIPAASTPC